MSTSILFIFYHVHTSSISYIYLDSLRVAPSVRDERVYAVAGKSLLQERKWQTIMNKGCQITFQKLRTDVMYRNKLFATIARTLLSLTDGETRR